MRKLNVLLLVICLTPFSTAFARDDRNRYSIAEAMSTEAAKEKLNKGYTFKFGNESHGTVVKNFGEFQSNKKTNAFNRSDQDACYWAFLSAMLSFQDRIEREGGNAVINLRSYYKKETFVSDSEFECGNGAIMAGVTFLGDVVTLE
ncbi:MAG: excinuclease ABC subunit A [Pseudomonadota bacterium]